MISKIKTPNKLGLAIALIFASMLMIYNPDYNNCVAHASDNNISDFCYRLDVSVTNNTGSDLTDKPVRVEIPTLSYINNKQMDSRGWDLRPTQGGFGNEIDLLTINTNNNQSPFYITFESIPKDETRIARLYLGNNEQKRNQGIIFTGNENLNHAYDSHFAITDNLKINVELEVLDSTAHTGDIIKLFDSNQGYRLSFLDDSGTLKLRAEVNGDACNYTWNTSWDNTNKLITYRFLADTGNDLFIDVDGVNVMACDTDESAITIPTTTLDIGNNTLKNTIIRDIKIFEGTTEKADYGFDFNTLSETSKTNPNYSGMANDYSSNNKHLTYTFVRDQSNINASVGGLVFTSTGASALLDTQNIDIISGKFGGNDIYTNTANTNAFGYDLLSSAMNNMGISNSLGFTIFFTGFALIFGLGAFVYTKSITITMFSMALPYSYASINGFIPYWWLIIFLLVMVTSYGATKWSESS